MGRVLLLIVGIVVALGLVAASTPQGAGQHQQGAARPSVEQSLETIAAATTKAVEPVEPKEYESPCDPGQDRRQSDLCAQWKAADGAARAAEWAKWQTILSAFGLVGLLYSLHLTRKAVREAASSSETADKAVEVNRISAERQLRAYLSIDKMQATGLQAGHTPKVWVSMRNRGQTPARRIRVKMVVVRCWGTDPESTPIRHLGDRVLYDLGPDQKTVQPCSLMSERITADQLISIMRGECAFVVAGYIRYIDVFGRTRRNIFRGTLNAESLNPTGEGHLVMSERHTRST